MRELCVPKLDSVVGVDPEGEGSEEAGGGEGELDRCCEEVAMTRKVVRSKRTTSVALQASASFARCLVRTEALGIRVWTMRDHAYVVSLR